MKSNLALALLVCVALAGCSIARESERSIITSGYDFTPYTAKGFFISPEQYLLPYESIGMIKVSFYPEVKRLASVTSFDRGKYDETTGVRTWLIEKIDVRAVIDAAYKQAFNMGADALVRFTVDTKLTSNLEITYPVYEVTGFAIKRK